MTQPRLILLSAWCVLCFQGCGGSDEPQRHALQGSVVVEGTAVAKGTISFLPSQGNRAQPAHTSIENGEYRFTKDSGPFSGAHRIVIGIKTTPADEPTAAAGGEAAAGQGIKEVAAPGVPNRYQRAPVTPKLQWEVEYTVPEDGSNQKDFDLSG